MAESGAPRTVGRAWLLDVLKAVGCVLIVLHHLAFYGPMSDVVMQVWPGLIEWLYDRARLAVQVFLVCGGFLTAASLSKLQKLDVRSSLTLLWRRYLRLVMPLLAALSVVVVVSEIIRPQFDHSSLSALPTWGQAWAHVALSQHLLNMEALSAGVWYVAMDFQLYATALVVFLLAQRLATASAAVPAVWRQRLWLALTAGSLLWWSGNESLDDYAVYFYGSYGLGYLAYKSREIGFSRKTWALVLGLTLLAWWLDPRWRLATALWAAALLARAPQSWLEASGVNDRMTQTVQWLSQRSYSIFVIHFAVSLAVNAFVTHFWPEQLWPNGLGMLASLGLSLCAGAVLFKWVEQPRPSLKRWAAWVAVFMVSVALAMKINGLAG
ncbi:MAG: acyltransferase family protein [Limnohabitans sp.]